MNKTQIEWVKNPDGTQGYTWNPITGCLNGCEYCYARKLANTRLRHIYMQGVVPQGKGIDGFGNPFYPRFHENRLVQPIKGYSRNDLYGGNHAASNKGIFVCDMSDLFGVGVPEDWTQKVLSVIRTCDYHRFYLLTKQPQNLLKFSPFPDNCWVGVSATNAMDCIIRVPKLSSVKTAIKFVSFEPLLDGISSASQIKEVLIASGVNWLIVGAQTKPYKPPKVEWVSEIVEAADAAGIPVFLKDNLDAIFHVNGNPDHVYFPAWATARGVYRQEMPVCQ